jgi:hypothetical protein
LDGDGGLAAVAVSMAVRRELGGRDRRHCRRSWTGEVILRPLAKETGHSIPTVTAHAMKKLQAYPWPGNIRELRNVLDDLALDLHLPPVPSAALFPMPNGRSGHSTR